MLRTDRQPFPGNSVFALVLQSFVRTKSGVFQQVQNGAPTTSWNKVLIVNRSPGLTVHLLPTCKMYDRSVTGGGEKPEEEGGGRELSQHAKYRMMNSCCTEAVTDGIAQLSSTQMSVARDSV